MKDVTAIQNAFCVFIYGLGTFLLTLFSGTTEAEKVAEHGLSAVSIILNALLPLFFGWYLLTREPSVLKKLFRPCSLRTIFGAFLLGVLVCVPLDLLAGGIHFVIGKMGYKLEEQQVVRQLLSAESPVSVRIAIAGCALTLVPLYEELLYRGIFYRGLLFRMNATKATIFSALFFALLHGSIGAFIPIFVLALFLNFVYLRYSLTASLALHIGFNFTNLLLTCFR